MEITHNKIATLPDEVGAEVNKGEWNDKHKIVLTSATIDVTGLTTLNMTGVTADIIYVDSTNPTETVTSITFFPDTPFELRPVQGLTLLVQVGGRGDVTLNGSSGDSCVMVYDPRVAALRMRTPEVY